MVTYDTGLSLRADRVLLDGVVGRRCEDSVAVYQARPIRSVQ